MNLNDLTDDIESLLPAWLAAQRWFSTEAELPKSVKVVDRDDFGGVHPHLLWTLIEVDGSALYQLPLGLRPEAELGTVLEGHDAARIGVIDGPGGRTVVYDGLVDGSICRALFDVVVDGAQAATAVRPIGAEQSNTSLVFDNRLILKVFRRLSRGANPDLEVTQALTDAGFPNIAPVVATWQRGDLDLAVCQPYLADGTEGWALALGSVRDLLRADLTASSSTTGGPASPGSSRPAPGAAGGDFSDEARRLGEATAGLHLALATQFGVTPFDPSGLIGSLRSSAAALSLEQQDALGLLVERLERVPAGSTGACVRIHGDFHLGQTLRAAGGWYIFDFEGEPARPLADRVRPTSPVKDVAGMLRSFHYAAAVGLRELAPDQRPDLADQADAWEEHNREAFRSGYLGVVGIDALLPSEPEALKAVFDGFEVEKAIYELAYERAYRPDWVAIPMAAIERLLSASTG